MCDKNILKLRKFLKNNIINSVHFEQYENQRQEIFNLIKRTIEHGESNSALLIGPRNSGKTTLVNNALEDLKADNYFNTDAVLVKLHGLIHTTDRLALKSINAQMNLETVVDGKVFGSFAENLSFLLACLKSGEKTNSKSVIFILDEFDLFCSHHNQTLIYNLFDVSQSPQTPVCVLGITCRLDVIELLEKRVKSRFSHRQIFLFANKEDNDENSDIENCLKRIKSYLTIPENTEISSSFRKQWNLQVKNLISNKKFTDAIRKLIELDLCEKTLKQLLIMVVSQLNNEITKITPDLFIEQMKAFQGDDIINVLHDLSVLELCLIIAMKHHIEIYDQNTMNFEMVFARYVKFCNANSNMQSTSREVFMKAFEKIENMELIVVINPGNAVQKEFQLYKLLVLPEQVKEAINKSSKLPTEVVQWVSHPS